MICKPCRAAADAIVVARENNLETAMRETVRFVAHLFHGLCKGKGHCDCQHVVDLTSG